jgi:hypothetical protein
MHTNTAVQFGPWRIAIDADQTSEAHERVTPGTIRCGCFFCRQFREGRATAGYRFFKELKALGLEAERETDVTHFRELEDGTHLFLGCYHAVGEIVEGPAEGEFHTWGENVEVAISRRRDALDASFPDPAIQIDFIVRLPWRGSARANQLH